MLKTKEIMPLSTISIQVAFRPHFISALKNVFTLVATELLACMISSCKEVRE